MAKLSNFLGVRYLVGKKLSPQTFISGSIESLALNELPATNSQKMVFHQ